MALPPTFIYAYLRHSPEATFEALRKAGLLRRDALGRKEEFVQRKKELEEQFFAMPDDGRTGPNLSDNSAYLMQDYLNETGLELANTPYYFQSRSTRMKIRLKKWKCRLRAIIRGY